jgi:phenylalanyl-tRNA synthetase beta chain
VASRLLLESITIMKVPLGWLREYVDLSLSVPQLAERLTSAGLEVASVRIFGLPVPDGLRLKNEEIGPVWPRDKIVIGNVLAVERHPNADRLTLATIDYGTSQHKTVVTGAPNIKVGDSGQRVILALSGSVLFDGHADEKVLRELKPSKIRGVASDAMVCSAYELGISDEHEGILLLEEDAPVGTPLADFMGEIVLELEVTPNLARCLCMIGVAREVAALTGQALRLPPCTVTATGPAVFDKVQVEIEDSRLSARYAALILSGVRHGAGPGWMQRRLSYAGMRPISSVVDITNYVMLEWGQPLHAFDYDQLRGRAGGSAPTIIVRPAHRGEILTTLDGNRRDLGPQDLIIADHAGPVALAGVMGGAETEVSSSTTNVLLEAANFDFRTVRQTMRAFNLPSEASIRFSRGIHPEIAKPAAERAAELIRLHAGATVCSGMVDVYPAPLPLQVITLELSQVNRLLGLDLPASEVVRILRALEFGVEVRDEHSLRITTPPHRLDIQAGSADLIEELVRVHGYERLPATLLADQLPEQHTNRSLVLEERVRDILVDAGLQEVITYALTEPGREAELKKSASEYVRLLNPISSERIVMRQTVLAGVLEVAGANLRHEAGIRLFEIGFVYLPRESQPLPAEPRRLALVMTGGRQPAFWGDKTEAGPVTLDFFDLKGVVEVLVADLHLTEVSFRPASVGYLHPGQSAVLEIRGKSVGEFGVLHPRLNDTYGLGERIMLAGEFDLEAILAAVPDRFAYQPVPRFPAALRDIAVIVDESASADRLLAEIRAAGSPLLREVRLFDLYRGESIPPGKKSLAYALSYMADDRTLTDKEVDKTHKKIEDRLRHVLKAQIRGDELAQRDR